MKHIIFLIFIIIYFPTLVKAQKISVEKDLRTCKIGIKKDNIWLIEPSLDNAYSIASNQLYVVYKGGKYGLYNTQIEKLVLNYQYSSIRLTQDNLRVMAVDQKGKFQLLDYKGKEYFHTDFSLRTLYYAKDFAKSYSKYVSYLFIAYNKGKVGVIDLKGNVIVPLEYKAINFVNDSTFFIVNDNGYGIWQNNQVLVKPQYRTIIPCGKGYAFSNTNLYGFLSDNGKELLDPIYSRFYSSIDDKAVFGVKNNNYTFAYNNEAELLTVDSFKYVRTIFIQNENEFGENNKSIIYKLIRDDKKLYALFNGKLISKKPSDHIELERNKYAQCIVLSKNKIAQAYTLDGESIHHLKGEMVRFIDNGKLSYIMLRKKGQDYIYNNNKTLITTKNATVNDWQYYGLFQFYFQSANKASVYDTTGQLVFDYPTDTLIPLFINIGESRPYSTKQYYITRKKNKFGLVDLNGVKLLDYKYTKYFYYSNNKNPVFWNDKEFVYLSEKGQIVKGKPRNLPHNYYEDLRILVNSSGKVLVSQAKSIVPLFGNFYYVETADGTGVYNYDKEIWLLIPEKNVEITSLNNQILRIRKIGKNPEFYNYTGGKFNSKYFDIIDFHRNQLVLTISKDSLVGAAYLSGEEILPQEYSAIYDINRGKAWVKKDRIAKFHDRYDS